jgi:diacylglycerol kinase (ATP)
VNVLLISNPASGGAAKHDHEALVEALTPLGTVRSLEPASREAFDEEVRGQAEECQVVVSAGGDGTFNCTVNALRDRLDDVTFGLVPMGTGNDLARTLGLADLEPVEVAQHLTDAKTVSLDVGIATGVGAERLFINACMGGFPVQVNEALTDEEKEKLGAAAFIWGGAKALTDLDRSTVTLNGISVPDCVAVGVGNGKTCGGGIEVWPQAEPGDGHLDGCALPADGPAALMKLAATLKLGRHRDLEGVTTVRSSTVTIDADPIIEINVDGELIGLKTPASFDLFTKTRILVPEGLHS